MALNYFAFFKVLFDLDDRGLQHKITEENLSTPPLQDQDESETCTDNLVLEIDVTVGNAIEESTQTLSFEGMVEAPDLPDNLSSLRHDFDSLKRSFDDDLVVLDPIVNTEKKAESPRKRLKRKLLIDEVIFIERHVIFDNLTNSSKILKQPVLAASTKRRMKQDEQNESKLSNGSFLELSPAIDKLFLHSKSRKFESDASADLVSPKPASEQGDSSQTGFENREDWFGDRFNMNSDNLRPDVLDMSEQFIPLQDDEYSSDEESPVENNLEGSSLSALEYDQDTLLTEEQTEEEQDYILEDENISDDKFCSHVETTVLQSRLQAVNFRQIVGCDCRKLTRKKVARRFLKCLLMQRDARLTLQQDESFKEILLHPGSKNVSEERVDEVSIGEEIVN